ncbi:MAG TPA: hypothetical protein VJ826_11695 [Candidatus Polarisedimenticolaceae bacterium]|nr:hypothetical protein [Candidatus Polarisedimenticolaceae bacterium]
MLVAVVLLAGSLVDVPPPGHPSRFAKVDDVRAGAHTVCVNPETHELYLPLESVKGRPVLRIMAPVRAGRS